MSKISIKSNKNQITVTNQLSATEQINDRVNTAIARGGVPGLIPLVAKKKGKERYLEANFSNLIPLNVFLARVGIVPGKLFTNIVYQIVCIAKTCEQLSISSNNLDLHLDRIFVDIQKSKIYCIYWPVVNNELQVPVGQFFKQLPNIVKLNLNENNGYLKEYIAFFKSPAPFSLNSFEQLVAKLSGKVKPATNAPSNKKESPSRENKSDAETNVEYNPVEIQSDEGLICTSCGTKNQKDAIYCQECGTKIGNLQEKILEIPVNQNVKTILLSYDEPTVSKHPYLIRMKTGEKILVNKPTFRIGKEKESCDYAIPDNSAISRNHADIITRNNRYYILDLCSKNKTYVDERVMPIEVEYEILHGTKLRFANESFKFFIE